MIARDKIQGDLGDRFQSRLLLLAGLFIILYALALTFSPTVRARSWEVDFRWDHWLGVIIWISAFSLAHLQSIRWLPGRDPFLLPLVGLLSGWGMLMIWRLQPAFGLRQALWLVISSGVMIAGLRLNSELSFLRRYKYLWLTGSLALTASTLLLGVNPMGYGPRMWLGCCGIYLQPSEPLKLMLIAYLAGYLAERYPLSVFTSIVLPKKHSLSKNHELPDYQSKKPLLPLLGPTLIMAGLAIMLLIIQRDLGTASIFFLLYAGIIYVATGRKRVIITALIGTLLVAGIGYQLFDVVRIRVDAWLNPWLDPSGNSYQIIQALLAIANGGLLGRGPGLGNPGLVPVVHSDLIYAAVAEEHGFIGSLGLLILFALITFRGLRVAISAADSYRRYLAVGIVALFSGQGLLIIGGSMRLFPLTGVTLPFFSYGGSSLLTSFVALLLLLHISARSETTPAIQVGFQTYQQLGAFLVTGFACASVILGWWTVVRGPDLLTRTDNPRRAIDDRSVRRGSVFDRQNNPIILSTGVPGAYQRTTVYPDLSNIVGYTNPTYGQAGVEASLDDYLRGLKGNSGLAIWWQHILYGQPLPGVDVRLSLDLTLQYIADSLLRGHRGALVLLDAHSGEILVMSSHPTFDANLLEQKWDQLVADPDAPLFNRALLGQYPLGNWEEGPFGAAFESVQTYTEPAIRLPARSGDTSLQQTNGLSPLQVALLAAALTADGVQPGPLFVLGVDLPQTGWVFLPALQEPKRVLPTEVSQMIVSKAAMENLGIWQGVWSVSVTGGQGVTWYMAGHLPGWKTTSFALALLLEQEDVSLAQSIGQSMLLMNLQPQDITRK